MGVYSEPTSKTRFAYSRPPRRGMVSQLVVHRYPTLERCQWDAVKATRRQYVEYYRELPGILDISNESTWSDHRGFRWCLHCTRLRPVDIDEERRIDGRQ